MKNSVIIGLVIIVFVAIVTLVLWSPAPSEIVRYESPDLKIAFLHPSDYFVVERDLGNGERKHRQIAIYKDTQENRDVIEGKSPGREGPISITFDAYQNDLDNLRIEDWIKGTANSNFKLSDGTLVSTTVSGVPAFSYRYSGLYENDAVVFEHNGNIILATASFIMPDDETRSIFPRLINSVELLR